MTVELEGHRCLARSVVKGKVTIDGVDATADVAGMTFHLNSTPTLEEIKGNFEALENGPCFGERGAFFAAR